MQDARSGMIISVVLDNFPILKVPQELFDHPNLSPSRSPSKPVEAIWKTRTGLCLISDFQCVPVSNSQNVYVFAEGLYCTIFVGVLCLTWLQVLKWSRYFTIQKNCCGSVAVLHASGCYCSTCTALSAGLVTWYWLYPSPQNNSHWDIVP